MTRMFEFTPTFECSDIEKLAAEHKFDEGHLKAVIYDAADFYQRTIWAQPEAGDDLDKLEETADQLLRLLDSPVNKSRLVIGLIGLEAREDRNSFSDCEAIVKKLHELPETLRQIRQAARDMHQPRLPGRPRQRGELEAAYSVLSRAWRQKFGDSAFTNVWQGLGDGQRVPTSPAACFLYDALKVVAPSRERLAEELEDLMETTIREMSPRGKGRKRISA
jgi:hypothetical protein